MRALFAPVLIALSLLGACVGNPVYRTATTPLATMPIEQERYLGPWYEQARLPNSFERNCVAAQADYALRDDGLIAVINTCRTEEGRTEIARGRARPVGEGKLKVSFFGPFWGDYWVLERAPDYAWSIVGEGEGRYLWLLTRQETLSAGERRSFEHRISALGYPVDALVWRQ